jgi:hypothetical protein
VNFLASRRAPSRRKEKQQEENTVNLSCSHYRTHTLTEEGNNLEKSRRKEHSGTPRSFKAFTDMSFRHLSTVPGLRLSVFGERCRAVPSTISFGAAKKIRPRFSSGSTAFLLPQYILLHPLRTSRQIPTIIQPLIQTKAMSTIQKYEPKDGDRVLPLFSLTGKTAAVSGAGAGIGLAVADALAEAGANVAIFYNSNPKAIERAEEIAKKYGVQC